MIIYDNIYNAPSKSFPSEYIVYLVALEPNLMGFWDLQFCRINYIFDFISVSYDWIVDCVTMVKSNIVISFKKNDVFYMIEHVLHFQKFEKEVFFSYLVGVSRNPDSSRIG